VGDPSHVAPPISPELSVSSGLISQFAFPGRPAGEVSFTIGRTDGGAFKRTASRDQLPRESSEDLRRGPASVCWPERPSPAIRSTISSSQRTRSTPRCAASRSLSTAGAIATCLRLASELRYRNVPSSRMSPHMPGNSARSHTRSCRRIPSRDQVIRSVCGIGGMMGSSQRTVLPLGRSNRRCEDSPPSGGRDNARQVKRARRRWLDWLCNRRRNETQVVLVRSR